jgi:hypothetical protein
MTTDELRTRFALYTDEIDKLLDAQAHWTLLHFVIVLPDICGALQSSNGEASGSKYRSWVKKYVSEPNLTPYEWYKIRCRLLHQGITLSDVAAHRKYIFCAPGDATHGEKSDHELTLDVAVLAKVMLEALQKWCAAIGNHVESTRSNYVTTNLTKSAKGIETRSVKFKEVSNAYVMTSYKKRTTSS